MNDEKYKILIVGYMLASIVGILFTFSIHYLEGNVTAGYFIFGIGLFLGILSEIVNIIEKKKLQDKTKNDR